jgi:hypothetical protein
MQVLARVDALAARLRQDRSLLRLNIVSHDMAVFSLVFSKLFYYLLRSLATSSAMRVFAHLLKG